MGSLPQEKVLYERTSWTVVHEQTFLMRVLPAGCSSSRTASAQVLSMGHILWAQITPAWMAPMVLPEKLFLCRLFSRRMDAPPQLPSGHMLLLQHGLHWLQCAYLLHVVVSHGVALSTGCRNKLPHLVLPHGLHGNPCSDTWSTSSPLGFTDFTVPLTPFFLTPLSYSCCTEFLPFLFIHFHGGATSLAERLSCVL